MYNSQYPNNPYSNSQKSQKLKKIKSQIRNRFHQQYFRNVRSQMHAYQARQLQEEQLMREREEMNQNEQIYANNCEQGREMTLNNREYSIKLNNAQQLFPEPTPTIPSNQTTDPNMYTSLDRLATLYNTINNINTNSTHSSSYASTIHSLISRVLEEIEARMLTMSMYMPRIMDQKGEILGEQDSGVLFMLFIVYRKLEDMLGVGEPDDRAGYRGRLLEICKGCGALGREMLSKFGILSVKAIQY